MNIILYNYSSLYLIGYMVKEIKVYLLFFVTIVEASSLIECIPFRGVSVPNNIKYMWKLEYSESGLIKYEKSTDVRQDS